MATRSPSSLPQSSPRWRITNFPFIKKREETGLLALHGLHFDLGSGELLCLEQDTGRFVAFAEP